MAVLGACLGIFDCSALMVMPPVVTDGAENAGNTCWMLLLTPLLQTGSLPSF